MQQKNEDIQQDSNTEEANKNPKIMNHSIYDIVDKNL